MAGRALIALPLACVALAGCGGDGPDRDGERPPAPIVVTASIAKDRVSVSPQRFGAGPITLVVTNGTDRSQQLTLETAGQQGLRQATAPINPRDNATLAARVDEGVYTVHVAGDDIRAATLKVGRPRGSSQQDLLLP